MDTNFSGINRSFCRNSSGAIFVGDLSDISTVEICAEWKTQVEDIIEGGPIPMFLCGNKVDLISDLEAQGRVLHELQTQQGLE